MDGIDVGAQINLLDPNFGPRGARLGVVIPNSDEVLEYMWGDDFAVIFDEGEPDEWFYFKFDDEGKIWERA